MYCTAANNNAPSISGEFVAMREFSDPAHESNYGGSFFLAWSPQTNRYKYQYAVTHDDNVKNQSTVGDFNLVIN